MLNAKDKILFAVKMIFGIKNCSDVSQKFPVTCARRIKDQGAVLTKNLNLIPVLVYQNPSVNYGVARKWAFILIQAVTA